jgi:serine/threonine protein kinase
VHIGTRPADVVLLLELAANGSLFDCIHKARVKFTPRLQWRIALQCAEAYAALHALKPPVIHRDIKSLNVLLDEDFHAKIADFGLATAQDRRLHTMGIGTVLWMAPEVHSGGDYSLPADVYSYGIMLWELWHHKIPYGNMNQSQVVLAVVTRNVRPPVDATTPPAIAKLMSRCWDKDAAKRPTFAEVAKELRGLEAAFK